GGRARGGAEGADLRARQARRGGAGRRAGAAVASGAGPGAVRGGGAAAGGAAAGGQPGALLGRRGHDERVVVGVRGGGPHRRGAGPAHVSHRVVGLADAAAVDGGEGPGPPAVGVPDLVVAAP